MAAPSAAFTVIPNGDIDPDSPITSGLMTSFRDNDQNLFAQLVGDPVGTPTFTPAAEHDHDGVNSKAVNGADFILVEKKLITSDTTSVTFSGLDGDTDEVYKLFGRVLVFGTNSLLTLRPNGISSNKHSRITEGGAAGFGISGLVLCKGLNSEDQLMTFEHTIFAKKNPNSVAIRRTMLGMYMLTNNGGNPVTPTPGSVAAIWNETATNITSLEVITTGVSDIRNGSTIALYKLRQ